MSEMKSFDVIIAGGAMAGATLALALSRLSHGKLSVAVIEAYQVNHQQHPGFDARSIALSHGTVDILRRFGLWESLKSISTPINHIHVSDRSHAGMTEIDKQDVGVEALGYVVELADVGRIYAGQIEDSDNISMYCPLSITDIERTSEQVIASLSDGSQIQSKLLVAADGAVSTCCEKIGLVLQEYDFKQVAVIANVVPSEAHKGRAFERFTSNGPVALLPMSDNRMSLVWCLSPDDASDVLSLDDSAFLNKLQSEFGWRLGKLEKTGSRGAYPLLLRYRERNVSHRFAIVGNAAQSLHPIAGQGFNLGIRDVATLVDEIIQAEDVGSYRHLSKFKQRRENDRASTIALTSGLVHLFSNDLIALRIGRNLGLMAMDNLPVLKTPLLRRTLGVVNR